MFQQSDAKIEAIYIWPKTYYESIIDTDTDIHIFVARFVILLKNYFSL